MIYLITGLPGNGKTLYAIDWVRRLAQADQRPVYYSGIKGLKLPWTEIKPEDWPTCPARSIIIIDECQRVFGVRPRGAPIPPHARELETHRHLGVDLVFITQSPMLLDNHDRSLIGTHYHVVRTFGLARATVYEFQQCRDDVLKRRADGVRHEWRYPRDVFDLYESAEVHTHKRRIPARVFVVAVLPFVIIGLCWVVWQRWHAKGGSLTSPVLPGASGAVAPAGPAGRAPRGPAPVLTRSEYLGQFEPRIDGLAYTAPAYDEVTKPTRAPYPAACVQSGDDCRCYTQQATRLEMDRQLCASIVRTGFFVAWEDAGRAMPAAARPAPAQAQAPAVPAPAGGAVAWDAGSVAPVPWWMGGSSGEPAAAGGTGAEPSSRPRRPVQPAAAMPAFPGR